MPAHLTALRRTVSGAWSLDQAHSLGEVVQSSPEAFLHLCRPMAVALAQWPAVTVDATQVDAVLAGRLVALDEAQAIAIGSAPLPDRVRLLSTDGDLVALARLSSPNALHADIVLR